MDEGVAARLARWRPAIFALLLAGVVGWLLLPVGRWSAQPACIASASPVLDAIAAVPVDGPLEEEGRDPRRTCLSTIDTPQSEEARRIFVLRDEQACSQGYCRTEIWQELHAGVYRPALPFAIWASGEAGMDDDGPIPTLRFDGRGDAGPQNFRLVYSLIEAGYVPITQGNAVDPPDVRPMRFVRTAQGLFGDGEVTGSSALYLEQAVRELGIRRGETLFLNSPGGSVQGGFDLGRTIRRLGLTTDIALDDGGDGVESGACMSACVYAFLGGARRQMMAGSLLAIHGPRLMRGAETGNADEDAVALADDPGAIRSHRAGVVRYLGEVGFPEQLADRILTVSASQMCSMAAGEMAGYGIVGTAAGRIPPAEPMRCWAEDAPLPGV